MELIGRLLSESMAGVVGLLQARAALKTDETNLSKGTIRSPVNGVVLSRKVEPGQTVVAAMTIPVLFTLAEDLTAMELQVKVDEADVGKVKVGMDVSIQIGAVENRPWRDVARDDRTSILLRLEDMGLLQETPAARQVHPMDLRRRRER